jgi:hypothetical protein
LFDETAPSFEGLIILASLSAGFLPSVSLRLKLRVDRDGEQRLAELLV